MNVHCVRVAWLKACHALLTPNMHSRVAGSERRSAFDASVSSGAAISNPGRFTGLFTPTTSAGDLVWARFLVREPRTKLAG